MKKVLSLLLMTLLVFGMMFALPMNASAASTVTQDGLEVAIVTDRDSYSADEAIHVSISIRNTNPYPISGVSIDTLLPEGLKIVSGELSFDNIPIAPGDIHRVVVTAIDEDAVLDPDDDGTLTPEPDEDGKEEAPKDEGTPPKDDGETSKDKVEDSKTEADASKKEEADKDKDTSSKKDKVTKPSKSPKTSDSFKVVLWIALLAVSAFGLFFIIKNRKLAKVLSLFLCAAIILTVITTGIFAQDNEAVFTLEKTIYVDGEPYVITAQVKYPKSQIREVHTVSFVSNGGNTVQAQSVIEGEKALKPNDPIKFNHIFGGWYTDASFENIFNFDTPITADITLYARWSSVDNGVATGNDNSVAVYSISNLSADKELNTVTATVNAPGNCALLVRFIEEDVYFTDGFAENKTYIANGELYASHVVAADSNMVEVLANVTGTLPDNFVAEAVLIDGTGAELCEPYTSIVNTSRYEQYDSRSVYDFAEDTLVLNFDSSTNDNFGVLADDVRILTAQEIEALDSNDDGIFDTYKILNPSVEPTEPIIVGDKIFISDEDADYMFKVSNAYSEGEYIVAVAAGANDPDGFKLDDFYKFIKVDMEYDNQEQGDGNGNQEPISTFSLRAPRITNIKDVSENVVAETTFAFAPVNFETEHFTATAETTGTVKASLVLEWDNILFGNYMRCDYTYTTDTKTEIDVESKSGDAAQPLTEAEVYSAEHSFGRVNIPFGVTGVNAFADVSVVVDWETTAGFKTEVTSKTESGFRYSNTEGFQNVDEKENNWTIECDGKAKVNFGTNHRIVANLLDGALNCELNCFFGANIEADEAATGVLEEGNCIHNCIHCIEGKLQSVAKVDAKCNYRIANDLIRLDLVDVNIVDSQRDLFDFYCSLESNADNIFGTSQYAGIGICPNRQYRTKLSAKNEQGENVDCEIKIYKADGNELVGTVPSGNGTALYSGQYIAKAVIGDSEYEKPFVIAGGPKVVTIDVTGVQSTVRGSVIDVLTGNPLANSVVEVYENSNLICSAFTDVWGAFNIALDSGEYDIKVLSDGYIPVSQHFSLRDGENKYLEVFKLTAQNNSNIMGGIYGTIVDAVTGNVLSDVNIKISKGWGNLADASTELVIEKTTTGEGYYEHKKTTVQGVDFGLDAGNYTVTISKDGYISTSFNITIVGGQDMRFDSSITPVGAEDVYHIVLTWGETPSDLDSHFNAERDGQRRHVYYSDREDIDGYYDEENGDDYNIYSNLDVDDVTSYGPETITIEDVTDYKNIRYSIHDYTNSYSTSSTELSFSSATVKVYKGGQLLETFYVPTGHMATVWNVFYMDEDYNIVPVNTFDMISNPSAVGENFNDFQ